MYKEYIWWYGDEQPRIYEYDYLEGLMLAYKQDVHRKGIDKIIIIKTGDNIIGEWTPLFRYDRKNQEEYNKCLTQNT